MTTDTISLVIGIAGAVVTVIAFFAALAFYHQGNRINRQTEQILARIDARVGVIQDDYSRIVDRTLDMAGEGSGALVSALSAQLAAVADSLKESVGGAIRANRDQRLHANATAPTVELETQIAAIIDAKIATARQQTTTIVEISGYQATYEGIVRLVLRSLRHGPILLSAVQRYMQSHCFELLSRDVLALLQRLEQEGLVMRRTDMNARTGGLGPGGEGGFWGSTEAGRAFPGVEDVEKPKTAS